MSWNRNDWLRAGGLLGLGATGLGLAGIGPLAGLLGAGSSAAAALGPGAAAEVGSAAVDTPGFAGLLGLTKGGPKALEALLKAQQLAGLVGGGGGQKASPGQMPRGQGMPASGDNPLWKIYGGMYG